MIVQKIYGKMADQMSNIWIHNNKKVKSLFELNKNMHKKFEQK